MLNIDWRLVLPSMAFSVAIPTVDLLARLAMPILGGIIWIFLKPVVANYRKKLNNKFKNQKIMKKEKIKKAAKVFVIVFIALAALMGLLSFIFGYEAGGFVRVLMGVAIIAAPAAAYYKEEINEFIKSKK